MHGRAALCCSPDASNDAGRPVKLHPAPLSTSSPVLLHVSPSPCCQHTTPPICPPSQCWPCRPTTAGATTAWTGCPIIKTRWTSSAHSTRRPGEPGFRVRCKFGLVWGRHGKSMLGASRMPAAEARHTAATRVPALQAQHVPALHTPPAAVPSVHVSTFRYLTPYRL